MLFYLIMCLLYYDERGCFTKKSILYSKNALSIPLQFNHELDTILPFLCISVSGMLLFSFVYTYHEWNISTVWLPFRLPTFLSMGLLAFVCSSTNFPNHKPLKKLDLQAKQTPMVRSFPILIKKLRLIAKYRRILSFNTFTFQLLLVLNFQIIAGIYS